MIFLASIVLAFFLNHSARHRAYKLRQVLEAAEAERYIVSSLFPSNVRDRLIEDATGVMDSRGKSIDVPKGLSSETQIDKANVFGSKPIADYFSDTTIMFAGTFICFCFGKTAPPGMCACLSYLLF